MEPLEHSSYVPGRAAMIIVAGKQIGTIGEIHPAVLEKFSIEMPVSAFEINLTKLNNG